MPIDLEELERLANDATPGPWHPLAAEHICGRSTIEGPTTRGNGRTSTPIVIDGASVPDAIFIAAAREAVPVLIAEVRRLRAEVERRPEISPETARRWASRSALSMDGDDPIRAALRAHAAKVTPSCSCSRRLGDYCPDVDGSCPIHGDAAKVTR